MNEASTRLETADIAIILQSLPHRYPFLMVDRVISMRADEFAIGIKNVTANEPQFMGHFPENPVFPGVLMIEGMAQTAGVLCITSGATGGPSKNVFFSPSTRRNSEAGSAGRYNRISHDQDCAEADDVVVPRRGEGRRQGWWQRPKSER